MTDNDVTALRLHLRKVGFHPLPLEGKAPRMPGWQQKFNPTKDEIRLWPKTWHLAQSTGVLAKFTPAVDIDITDEDAAEAVEALAREFLAEHGDVYVRIGKAPKRLIPLRTDEPFTKMSRVFIAPNGTEQKIEILGDGQQYVVDGIHPETGRPYSWHGGDLQTIKREDLPYVRRGDVGLFLDAVARLLVKEFGYVERGANGDVRPLPHVDAPPQAPEVTPTGDASDTSWDFKKDTRLRSALNAIPADEKALTEKSGDSHITWVNIGRAIERLGWGEHGYAIWRDWCAQNALKFDEKGLRENWASFKRTRNARDNPVTIATVFHLAKQCGWSGLEKVEKDGDQKADTTPLIKSSGQFIAGFVPPDYVVTGLLQRRFLYACTGQTGAGKTAITLRLAASVALGVPFADRKTKKSRVLYAAAENPDDVRMRWIALAQHMGFDPQDIEVFFIEGRFTISKAAARLRAEAERGGGNFGLVVIDTGPAFFEGDDENNRAQMGAHARLMRGLITTIPGQPCIVVNCHPVKNATADNLLPAGGGTFLNEIDGNLTAARTDNVTELHWQGKFRGPEFSAMNFMIKTVTHQDLKDSDGRLIPTVICECIGEQAREEIAAAKRNDEDKVLSLIERDPTITQAKIAQAMKWELFDGKPHRTKAARCIDRLVEDKLVKETRSGRWQLTPEGKKVLEGGEK